MEQPDAEDRWKLSSNASRSQPAPIKKFRLLIIGKSGCGKTTILSKVCGEEVADKPSTTRGTHNIEREMEFKTNNRFVVHDSEGFEAGQDDEYRVVADFIESRGRKRDINERLHAIWYCLTTSSRPIQQAEEIFFSEKHDVPVVAVFTKFDLFVESQLQDLMEDVEDLDEDLETELERQAESKALEKFDHHFKGVLLSKPYPPSAVVALSDMHDSTPRDTRLGELIKETMVALKVEALAGTEEEQELARRLASLFSAAQQADLLTKYDESVNEGTPYILEDNGDARCQSAYWRRKLIEQWNEKWEVNVNLLAAFETNVEKHPMTLGNSTEVVRRQDKELTSIEIEAYRCILLVLDLTVIMAQLFLLKVEDEKTMINIIERYISTATFSYIRKRIFELDIWSVRTKQWGGGFMLFRPPIRRPCVNILDEAVRLLFEG